MQVFYETVDDITADAGIRVRATNLRELVCKVLLATFNEITDIDRVREREVREVEADGGMPFVLADLINAALLIHGSDGFVACRCEPIKICEKILKVKLFGERFNPSVHTSKLVIKAATYHRLEVRKDEGGYFAQVIFDI